MRISRLAAIVAVTCCGAGVLAAQQQPADSTGRRQQRTLDSLVAAMNALRSRVDSLERAQELAPAASAAGPARSGGSYMNMGFDALSDFGWASTPDIGKLLKGDHDPRVRGFTVPNVELTFEAAVDPYFKGFSALVYKLDAKGETSVEVEEAWAQSTSLPFNLQVKAGQFLTEFGRQNAQHPHAWAFVDQPLVLNQMFGKDGFRGQGAKVSWLVPTEFYTEATLSVLNSAGGTTSSFRSDESGELHGGVPIDRPVNGLSDLLVVPRLATSLDLTETQTIVLGASAGFGPNNSGAKARTSVYGADLYYKWKAEAGQAGFPFVAWQTEVLARRYDAAARIAMENPGTFPAETLSDWGGYSQLLWGIRPRLIAGIRGDITRNSTSAFASDVREDRERVSPNLTLYPSEFSKLRLQYNYDRGERLGREHSIWLQFEFMMGAHAAHKF